MNQPPEVPFLPSQAPFDFALGCVGAVLLAMAGYLLGWRRARPSWLLLTTAGEPSVHLLVGLAVRFCSGELVKKGGSAFQVFEVSCLF